MKLLWLSNGKVTIVDELDVTFLNQWNWRQNSEGYAVRGDSSKHCIYMHRVVAERAGLNIDLTVDHIDGDRLNNLRSNLRSATWSQNLANRPKYRNNTTACKGVFLDKRDGKYGARIRSEKKAHWLGRFSTAEEAASAYNRAAIDLFGEFAYLNPL
jgi:hypothetical protein